MTDPKQQLQEGDQEYTNKNYQKALELYNAALESFRQQKDALKEADTLLRIGDLYNSLSEENYQAACKAYRDLAIKPSGNIDWAKFPWKTPGKMGDAVIMSGDFDTGGGGSGGGGGGGS